LKRKTVDYLPTLLKRIDDVRRRQAQEQTIDGIVAAE